MNTQIPYLDLSIKNPTLKKELLDAVDTVLTHGRLVLGPEVEKFEKEIARRAKRKFAVGLSTGTDALYLGLQSIGIGPGDEVITSPLSWIATFHAIARSGATPVCVDICNDQNIDPDKIEAVITPRTKAIMIVHFTGKMCEMDQIMKIANQYGLEVIEDSAQAFGADYKNQPAGSFGKVSCFSMNTMKILNSFGEAGAVVTDDPVLREKLVSLRYSGIVDNEKQQCKYISLNSRLHTLQAAMLLVSLRYVDKKIEKRREIAKFYREELKDIVVCPEDPLEGRHIYYTFAICAERRDELQSYLTQNGIESKVHHRILMPHQEAYRYLEKYNIQNAERVVSQILSIPNHEALTGEETAYVVKKIKSFYEINS